MVETDDPTNRGRVTVHTDDEHRAYWTMTDEEKQDFLRREYGTRRRNGRVCDVTRSQRT